MILHVCLRRIPIQDETVSPYIFIDATHVLMVHQHKAMVLKGKELDIKPYISETSVCDEPSDPDRYSDMYEPVKQPNMTSTIEVGLSCLASTSKSIKKCFLICLSLNVLRLFGMEISMTFFFNMPKMFVALQKAPQSSLSFSVIVNMIIRR